MPKKEIERSAVRPTVIAVVVVAGFVVTALWVRSGRHVAEEPSAHEASHTAERVQQRLRQLSANASGDLTGNRTSASSEGEPLLSEGSQGGRPSDLVRRPSVQSGPGGVQSRPAEVAAGPRAFQIKPRQAPQASDGEPMVAGGPVSLAEGLAIEAPVAEGPAIEAPVAEGPAIEAPVAPEAIPMSTLNSPQQIETEVITIPATLMERDLNASQVLDNNVVVAILTNSSMVAHVELRLPAVEISVRAFGQEARGVWPELRVSVDGTLAGTVTVNSGGEQEYPISVSAEAGRWIAVTLEFVNDYYDPDTKEDRNVFIRQLTITTAGPPGG